MIMTKSQLLKNAFKATPTPTLVLRCNPPHYTIVAVNTSSLIVTKAIEADIIGKGIFEAFPTSHNDMAEDGTSILSQSLSTVVATGRPHHFAARKYDIPIRGSNEFETKYWTVENTPVFAEDGTIESIINTATDVTAVVLEEKKQAALSKTTLKFEAALEKSETDFKKLFNDNHTPTIVQDLTTSKIIDDSDEIQQEHGHTKDDFFQLTEKIISLNEYIPLIEAFVNSEEASDETYKKTLQHKQKKDELTFVNVDGHFADYEGRKTPVEALKNITEKLSVKRALEESNQRYQYAIKIASDTIWDLDLTTNVMILGERFNSTFGYSFKEQIIDNAYWNKFCHPDDIDRILETFTKAINSEEKNWIDRYRFLKADNTYAYVINKAFIIRDERGKAIRMVGAKRDITKRRAEDMRLKLLETVVTHAHDAVIIAEAEPINGNTLQIIYVNEAFTRMTGYTPEEMAGKTPRILQGHKTDKRDTKRLGNAVKNWESCEITVVNYRKNGEEFWSNIAISPVADETGWFTHWIGIQRDVTESVLKEQNITKAIIKTQEDERYEIGAELHDNVCQILAASQIWLKMLRKDLSSTQAVWYQQGIDYISAASHEIRNLSHRLAPAFFEDTSLEQAFNNLIKNMNMGNECNVKVQFDDAFKQHPIEKDFHLNLYRILQEQLRNISKYANPTRINVTCIIEDDKLKMTIYDDGIGFDTSIVKKGGIGFANMKRRTELFEGKFEIASSPGNGCKIAIEIPLS